MFSERGGREDPDLNLNDPNEIRHFYESIDSMCVMYGRYQVWRAKYEETPASSDTPRVDKSVLRFLTGELAHLVDGRDYNNRIDIE